MDRPAPNTPKRSAPLPSAIGAKMGTRQGTASGESGAATQRTGQHGSGLPTVEEVSAGGVVVDQHEGRLRVPIIARVNRGGRVEWCLPKGHPEGAESHSQAAVREIAEETGIDGEVLTPLGSIDYWFTVTGHRVHKTVHHFLLRATGGILTIDNDPDHEAIDVAWSDLGELPKRLSFPNERRIADLAAASLPSGFPTHVL
ncbi:NUDIX hydrolase [Acaricomes phytoseiuli]|uniref:NUDIX hydrolase n=1 Tax=Acaricomes phytoseiuli TaxID=291968 RepID=UPI0003816975|nr:NUDIX hydrolase [Acaricomes phytoseiuli]